MATMVGSDSSGTSPAACVRNTYRSMRNMFEFILSFDTYLNENEPLQSQYFFDILFHILPSV